MLFVKESSTKELDKFKNSVIYKIRSNEYTFSIMTRNSNSIEIQIPKPWRIYQNLELLLSSSGSIETTRFHKILFGKTIDNAKIDKKTGDVTLNIEDNIKLQFIRMYKENWEFGKYENSIKLDIETDPDVFYGNKS